MGGAARVGVMHQGLSAAVAKGGQAKIQYANVTPRILSQCVGWMVWKHDSDCQRKYSGGRIWSLVSIPVESAVVCGAPDLLRD